MDEGYALSVLLDILSSRLTNNNPQHVHWFRRKGPQGNGNCTQERTLFTAPLLLLCDTEESVRS